MNEWTIRVKVESEGDLTKGGQIDTMPDTSFVASEPTATAAGRSSMQAGLTRKVQSTAENYMLSPLNSATGGMARPVYTIAKGAMTGKGALVGAGAMSLAIVAVNLAIQKINERVAKLENEAQQANNRDNLLITAGSQASAVHYKADFFKGVRKVNRG